MGWGPPLTKLATVACFAGVALLAVGVDFSPLAMTPPHLQAAPGDTVTLEVKGTLDNGTVFLNETALRAVLGNGDVAAGLEQAVTGLAAGQPFRSNVSAQDGYGPEDPQLVTPIARFENEPRTFEVPLARFQEAVGQPYKGEVVQTRPWPATVVSSDDPVVLSYDAAVGAAVPIYRYWTSQVTTVTNRTITWQNLLHKGDQFHLATSSGTQGKLVRATAENATTITLDSNPPLAGQALHFVGRLVAIQPGTGIRRSSGMASSLSGQSCESCHGGAGFNAVSAQASAVQGKGGIVVNVTLDDPWLHDVNGIQVTARAANLTQPVAVGAPDLPPQGTHDVQLTLPSSAASSVELTINATAHHVHQSGGKPDNLPYQLQLRIPVGGARQGSATAPKSSLVVAFDAAGSLTGFAALAVLLFPAVQGYRRHLRRKPLLRLPPWLTTHVAVSLAAIALTFLHAEASMSGTWHGNWSWGVILGALAMVGLGFMGLTGIVMAGWTRSTNWPKLKRTHFIVMLALVALSLVHAWAVGTHFQILR